MYLNDKRVVPNHVLNKTQRTSFYEKKQKKKTKGIPWISFKKGAPNFLKYSERHLAKCLKTPVN